MPARNQFRHQNYPTAPALRPVLKRVRADGPRPDFSQLHTRHGIHRVILVHGTFLGDDPLGIAEIVNALAENSRFLKAPLEKVAEKLQEATKPIVDGLAKDVANYAPEFRDAFQALVGDDPTVEFLDPTWSSQNHHIARADLAIRLFLRLSECLTSPDQRALLWGHSHAGNGFALLSNLLANDRKSVDKFFQAAGNRGEHWQRAHKLLRAAGSPHPLAQSIDIVTFGTPVRYGWDTTGVHKLLHITHHREAAADNPTRTEPLFPPHRLKDTVSARYGDWVQAFAIAGTDVPTGTSLPGHLRMSKVLHAGLAEPQHGLDTRFILPAHVRDACARWKTGTRCHSDGLNLLLEYQPCGRRTKMGQPIEESVLGHGVATVIEWLPTHLAEVLTGLDTV